MIFSLVAMTGLEKCCITSAYLQWLCHSGERPVARGPLVCACHILRTLHARVLKFYIWVPNEKIADPYFVSCLACLFKVMPLWKKSELNLMSKISWKVFKLGSWNSIQWVGMMCTLPDYVLREFHENIDKVTALCSSAHFDLVSKISRKALKLGSWNIICWLGMMWRLPGLFFREFHEKLM